MVGAAILMLDLMLLPLPLLQQLPLLPLLLDDLMLLLLELELWLLLRLTLLPLPLPEQALAWKSHHVQWVRCAAASLASRPCLGTACIYLRHWRRAPVQVSQKYFIAPLRV